MSILLSACTVMTPAASGPARVQVVDAWLRPAAAHGHSSGDVTTALYMTLVNAGGEADRLLSVRADFATAAELHETRIENEVMTMRPLPGGIEVPAGGRVELKPGGLHVMLIGVKEALPVGETRPVTLRFERSGTVEVVAEVREP